MPSRNGTRGAYPISRRARVMSNARLFVKKSTRRRYNGGSIPNGVHTASHTAPAIPWPIKAGRPSNRHLDVEPIAGLPRETIPFELCHLIDVAGLEGCVLV